MPCHSASTPSVQADTNPRVPVRDSHVPLIRKQVFDLQSKVESVRECLLRQDAHILAIIGMGGIGKTTLAQAVCKDWQVQSKFTVVVWVVFSRTPNIEEIQKSVWRQLTDSPDCPRFATEEDGLHQLESYLDKMPQHVLMVYDDVWNTCDLRFLAAKTENCKMLITTRKESVASQMHAECYHVRELSAQPSKQLFCLHAF